MAQRVQETTTRVAVVTGAAGRLGQAICAEFADRGFSVAAIVRSNDDASKVPNATAMVCDVSDEEAVVAVYRRIRNELGPIGYCVHTVGTWGMRPIVDTSLDDWRGLVDTNLTTAFLCLREATRHMVADGFGGLVAIASRQGAEAAPARQGAYSASKAGVIRLVEAIANEHAASGVSARTVAPSTILFEGDSGAGITAADLARLCVDLADPGHPSPTGSVVRAYGSAV